MNTDQKILSRKARRALSRAKPPKGTESEKTLNARRRKLARALKGEFA